MSCLYIIIAQYNKMGSTLQHVRSRVVSRLRNTYTGPVDVLLCTKPEALTLAGNQAIFNHPRELSHASLLASVPDWLRVTHVTTIIILVSN